MTLNILSLAQHSRRSLPHYGLALGIGAALLGTVSTSSAAPSASSAASSKSSSSSQSGYSNSYVDPYAALSVYGEEALGAVPDIRVNETPLQHASQEYSQNHFERAAPELEMILKKTPQDVRARLLLSAIYLQQKQAQRAVSQLETACCLENAAGFRTDSRSEDKTLEIAYTQNLLATAYLQTGQTQKAIRIERTSLARAPKDPQTAFQLGTALTQAGNLSEAAEAFAKAAALDRKDSRAAFLAGLLYHQVGEDAKAVPALKKALALGPPHKFEVYSALAEAASNAGNFQDAVAADTLALRIQPSDFPTLANLGVENQNLGRTEQARALYQQALALKTGDPNSRAEISADLENLSRT